MKYITAFAVILTFFSFKSFAQCEGSESHIIDGVIETFNKVENYREQKPKVKKDKTDDKETLGSFSISGLNGSENYFNRDVLVNWNVGFSEGLAKIIVDGKSGFINRIGEFVIEPKFERAESFSEGFAVVGFYDKTYVWTTHERTNGKWVDNFIDKNGNIKFPKNFDGIYKSFNGGMAVVGRNIGYKDGVISEWYFIDTQGRELWILDSWHLTEFSEDLIVVAVSRDKVTKRDKYSFLDRNGKRITENVFDNLDAFSEGLAVATVDGKDGFIDKTGKFVIDPKFFSAGSFSEDLAAVWENGESGFIDKQGNWKIKIKFNSTEGFREGYAAIETGGKIGYIDRHGNYIWKPTK